MATSVGACPICRASGCAAFGAVAGYRVARCRSCGHSFVQNMPSHEELVALYDVYSYDTQHLAALPAFLQSVVHANVRSFEPFRRSGRLLDVGFGAGALLHAALSLGWEAHGVETSRLAVEQAKANGIEDVVLGDFREVCFERASFDVIVMSELIEHLPEPVSFARRARELLSPGGLLYVTTPHGRGVSGRVLRSEWSVCSPPEHLHLFSRASIVRCLRDAGFGAVDVEFRGIHPHELVHWLKRRIVPTARQEQSGEAFGAYERNVGSYRLNAALVGSGLGRLSKRVANRILDVTSLGDGIVARALA